MKQLFSAILIEISWKYFCANKFFIESKRLPYVRKALTGWNYIV